VAALERESDGSRASALARERTCCIAHLLLVGEWWPAYVRVGGERGRRERTSPGIRGSHSGGPSERLDGRDGADLMPGRRRRRRYSGGGVGWIWDCFSVDSCYALHCNVGGCLLAPDLLCLVLHFT
jgi:hypothetical protein